MKVLLMAEEGERKLLDELAEEMGCHEWLSEYKVIITGVGAINIARAIRELPLDTEILNIGYAGSANFPLGSWVEVSESRLNHPNVTYPEPEQKLQACPKGMIHHYDQLLHAICYSNTDFVLQSDYKDCVFDMELAYILAPGYTNVRAIKKVSDNLSLHTYHEHTHGVE